MSVKAELLETIQLQEQLIKQQAETIFKLVNENLEQENLINELMKDVKSEDGEMQQNI